MGAWGPGTFENDDACDWIYELEGSTGFSAVEEALDGALTEGEYLEAPDGSTALAAAEIVAAAGGQPSPALPEEAAAWLAGKPRPSSQLVAKALRAVAAVLGESELRDLWEEGEGPEGWVAAVEDLRSRLASL